MMRGACIAIAWGAGACQAAARSDDGRSDAATAEAGVERGAADATGPRSEERVARSPDTLIPGLFVTQLVASDGAANDQFGAIVAFDGTTIVVGAPSKTIGKNASQGAVYVFVSTSGAWTQQGPPLVAPDGAAGDNFGASIAVSGDTLVASSGKKLAVGSGEVFTFARSAGTWSQVGPALLAPAAHGEYWSPFGQTLALADSTLVVGVPQAYNGASPAPHGAVQILTQSASAWSSAQTIVPSSLAWDFLGNALAFDGTTLVAGAYNANVGSNANQGAAVLFRQTAGSWSPVGAPLVSPDGLANDQFGAAVALSGNTVAVTAPRHPRTSPGIGKPLGATYGFTLSGATPSASDALIPHEVLTVTYGGVPHLETIEANRGATAVAAGNGLFITADDDTGWNDTALGGGADTGGRAYAFALSGTAWVQSGTSIHTPMSSVDDFFGASLALSGGILVSGAPQTTVGANALQGAAYVFAPASVLGDACSSATTCQSGNCVDGVCCDGACTGQCEACDVAGALGTCSPVAGVPHLARTPCLGAADPCGARCLGTASSTDACVYAASGTACGPAVCSASGTASSQQCDGAGKCSILTTTCGSFACDAGACNAKCAAMSDCVAGADCDAGVCVPPTSDAGVDAGSDAAQEASVPDAATAPDVASAPEAATNDAGAPVVTGGVATRCQQDSQCATQHCVDGVCCDSTCAGNCVYCAFPSAPGHCVLAPSGFDPRGACGPASSCTKTCDGTGLCIGAGPGTVCAAPSCTDASHGVGLARCSAADTPCDLSSQEPFDCFAYACESALGACYTSCSSTSQCAPNFVCDTGSQTCVAAGGALAGGCAIDRGPRDRRGGAGGLLAMAASTLAVRRRRRERRAR